MVRYNFYKCPIVRKNLPLKQNVCLFLIFFLYLPLFSITPDKASIDVPEEEFVRQQVLLLPVSPLVNDPASLHLKPTIYNVLKLQLEKQQSLDFINSDEEKEEQLRSLNQEAEDFETLVLRLQGVFPGATSITCEYYLDQDRFYLLVNVWDLNTRVVKRFFTESLPADLEMLENLQTIALKIAEAVAGELPPSPRESLFMEQVMEDLRDQIAREEEYSDLLEEIKHEVWVTPFSGIIAGSITTWTQGMPLLAPALGVEYTGYLTDLWHWRVGLDFALGIPGSYADGESEITLSGLFGYHTRTRLSFFVDAGLAVSYVQNPAAQALAPEAVADSELPAINRWSISLPLQVAYAYYLSPHFFINIRFRSQGLGFTIETLDKSQYSGGTEKLAYSHGFSYFNLLAFTFALGGGICF